jgi:hypothetical protein
MLIRLQNEGGDSEYIVQTDNITFIHPDGSGSRIHFVGGHSIKINASIKLLKYMLRLEGGAGVQESKPHYDKTPG